MKQQQRQEITTSIITNTNTTYPIKNYSQHARKRSTFHQTFFIIGLIFLSLDHHHGININGSDGSYPSWFIDAFSIIPHISYQTLVLGSINNKNTRNDNRSAFSQWGFDNDSLKNNRRKSTSRTRIYQQQGQGQGQGQHNEQDGQNSIQNQKQPSSSINQYYITPETLSQIKSQANIVTVIESYYNLPQFSKSVDGTRATALCPFHDDNNPSLSIDGTKGIYKCFSCGAGGDVFNFVREYDYLDGDGTGSGEDGKMNFPEAVRKVANDFCSDNDGILVTNPSNYDPRKKKLTKEEMKKVVREKQRTYLINSAAADFYAKMLITLPGAGVARTHLRNRGITPNIVRTFALGYAPDVYFGNNKNFVANKSAKHWGKGSCVERLKELGFTPREIVDAGLATVTNAAKKRLQQQKLSREQRDSSDDKKINVEGIDGNNVLPKEGKGDNEKEETNQVERKKQEEEEELKFSDIMDRFRGRLIVPIFDFTGKHVLGFGGRHLDKSPPPNNDKKSKSNLDKVKVSSDDKKSKSFVPAKYINSPETSVFVKKNTLFGLHGAKAELKERSDVGKESSLNSDGGEEQKRTRVLPSSIVIVEGYFDAVVLYGAGVREVTACMGSALTLEQLSQAAKTVGGSGGRITLCLDSDDAGVNAVARVCAGQILWDLIEKTGVEVFVSSIPDGAKDPADFILANGGIQSTASGDAFRSNVLEKARMWGEWYIQYLISQYQTDGKTSLADIRELLTTFLSKFSNAAERKQQAYKTADILADQMISVDGNNTSSGALRIQLESDLLNISSRKAAMKDAFERRVGQIDDGDMNDRKKLMEKLSRGNGATPLSQNEVALSTMGQKPNSVILKHPSKEQSIKALDAPPPRQQQQQRQVPQFRESRMTNTRAFNGQYGRKETPALTEHFSGFEFNPTDASWLLDGESKSDFVLGHMGVVENISEQKNKYRKKKDQAVYFNSNIYLGSEFITPEAMYAGYGSRSDQGISRKQVMDQGNLLSQDANRILMDAETRLLKTMINFPQARLAMKSALHNSMDFNPALEWSSLDRSWLFSCLTDSSENSSIPDDVFESATATQFRRYLQTRSDLPISAFNIPSENEKNLSIDGDSQTEETITLSPITLTNSSTAHSMKRTGTLELFFSNDDDPFIPNLVVGDTSLSDNVRAELIVQETVAVMLKATAQKRLSYLKNKWEKAANMLSLQEDDLSANPQTLAEKNDLKASCLSLSHQVSDAMKTVRELTESSNALSRRLLDYCASGGSEGRLSTRKQEDLGKMLDDHLASLPDDPPQGDNLDRIDDESFHNGIPNMPEVEFYDDDDNHEFVQTSNILLDTDSSSNNERGFDEGDIRQNIEESLSSDEFSDFDSVFE